MKIFFIGDVYARPGRMLIANHLANLRESLKWDVCIANAENAAGGKGINFNIASELFDAGIDAITMGNHTWARKEIFNFIDSCPKMVRPANYPKGTPGRGRIIIENNGIKIGLLNLIGRIYMDPPIDCPFQTADREIAFLKQQCKVILVDMHAEATSEKIALGHYLDGRVSAVVGTHTHVQTADEKILEKGTAFICDAGMTGPSLGVIGVEKQSIINKFITGIPGRFEPAEGEACLNAVLITIDDTSGKALDIIRVSQKYRA